MLTGVFYLFSDFFCHIFEYGEAGGQILILSSVIVIFDAYNAIFFAELRYAQRSVLYSVLRLVQVLVTVALTLFFLLFLRYQDYFDGYFMHVSNVNYILIANLFGSASSTVFFLPRIANVFISNDFQLLRTVIVYSVPLVGMGFFGICNQNIEKILILKLDPHTDALSQLAIYGANYKIGILMAIFTQSFRMAFEPFFFKQNKEKEKTDIYGDALKYFVYFGLLIFAGVILFRPLIVLFGILTPEYYEGMVVIPLILIGQLFFGVYYSLSMWYKVIDKTYFGVLMSILGLLVNTCLNFILIPRLGYYGAAISTLVGYFVMMLTSFIIGNVYYPISYPFKRITFVAIATFLLVFLSSYAVDALFPSPLWILISSSALALYIFFIIKVEHISVKSLIR